MILKDLVNNPVAEKRLRWYLSNAVQNILERKELTEGEKLVAKSMDEYLWAHLDLRTEQENPNLSEEYKEALAEHMDIKQLQDTKEQIEFTITKLQHAAKKLSELPDILNKDSKIGSAVMDIDHAIHKLKTELNGS